jgi:hypothetical protein
VRIACVLLIFAASLASAQTTDPQLSDTRHAKIRDIQLQQKQLETQYLQLEAQKKQIESQFNGLATQLNSELDAAYADAHVKREDWSLDLATLRWSKIEKPKPADKPDAKKP